LSTSNLFDVSRNVRTYDHFCMLARALEQVGDRWTLLVVRDLLGAPRRFTDLMDRLGGITPKTLTQRLRELQDAGIVEVDRQPGRREVWYRLTPAGHDLAPAVQSLFLWGLRHAARLPLPGEAVHAEHLLSALRATLDQAPPPRRPLVWRFDLADDMTYTLRSGDDGWALARGTEPDDADATPDVVVTTDTGGWTRFLMTPPDQRQAHPPGIEVSGSAREIDRFLRRIAPFPYAVPPTQPSRV
jgi:DNA-binding HxlR family transcriptional regulator